MVIFSLIAGSALGLMYFLGLWATVRHLPALRWTPFWLPLSFFLRLGFLLAGLYWIGGGDWRRFVAALVGIFLVRLALTRRIGAVAATTSPNPSNSSTR